MRFAKLMFLCPMIDEYLDVSLGTLVSEFAEFTEISLLGTRRTNGEDYISALTRLVNQTGLLQLDDTLNAVRLKIVSTLNDLKV